MRIVIAEAEAQADPAQGVQIRPKEIEIEAVREAWIRHRGTRNRTDIEAEAVRKARTHQHRGTGLEAEAVRRAWIQHQGTNGMLTSMTLRPQKNTLHKIERVCDVGLPRESYPVVFRCEEERCHGAS